MPYPFVQTEKLRFNRYQFKYSYKYHRRISKLHMDHSLIITRVEKHPLPTDILQNGKTPNRPAT